MKRKKIITRVLAIALAVNSITAVAGKDVQAAAAPKLSATKKTVTVGKTFSLKVKKVKGIKKLQKVTWKTSKEKVAKVKAKGKFGAKVTAVSTGKAKITATVNYLLSSKKNAKKAIKCTVTVNAAGSSAETNTNTNVNNNANTSASNKPADNTQQTDTNTQQQETQPTKEPVPATPEPTRAPYYDDKGYYAGFDGSKTADGTDNLYVNYVMVDSKEVNKKSSAVKSVKFKIDTKSAIDIDIYVSEFNCNAKALGESAKVGSFKTDGSDGQTVNVNLSGSALSSLPNEKISFGFLCKCDKEEQFFILHDMSVSYGGQSYPATLTTKTVGCTSKADGVLNTRGKDSSAIISDDYTSLCKLTEEKGYKFGTCVTYEQITSDKQFCELIKKHCDSITATNEFKAYSLLDQTASKASENGMPAMNYEKADAICEFAKEANLKIRGHALVWDQSMKQWFFNEGYNDDSARVSKTVARQRLKYYIEQVIKHFEEKYPGVIYCWDVVNEGIDPDASSDSRKIRTTRDGVANPFYTVVGNDYIEYSFKCARDTLDSINNKSIDLVYNDFNVIYGNKRTPIINLVKAINSYDGNRKLCDAVGMQGYLGYGRQTNCLGDGLIDNVIQAIQELSNNGVKVQLTEMAMRNFTNSDKYMSDHASFSKKLFTRLADINKSTNGAFTSMSLWAFIDNPIQNYTDDNYEYDIYTPYSGLFDDVFTAKDSFFEVYKALGGKLPN